MPRSGAVMLSDLLAEGEEHLRIMCDQCGRAGRYSVSGLLKKHGDMGLPDMLAHLSSDCDKHKSASVYDRCRATIVRK